MLEGKVFEAVVENDLQRLISTGVPEGVAIEYKRDCYGRNDEAVKEWLKDISSFANTAGGHLIVGMEEDGGVATHLVPINSNIDQELQRLESLARDGLEPRVAGLQMRAIPLSVGGWAIVVRVPRSWNPPHRVTARNTSRFYKRNSAGAYEPNVDELRMLFGLSLSATERVRAFRSERLVKLKSGETPVPLAEGRGLLVVHLVPFLGVTSDFKVDLAAALTNGTAMPPLGSTGHTPAFNFEGFINYRGGDSCHGYTQLFRNGSLEATKVGILAEKGGPSVIPTGSFERTILTGVPPYLRALQMLAVEPPLVVMITLIGVKGAVLGVSDFDFDSRPQPLRHADLDLPEVIIEDYGDGSDFNQVVKPVLDVFWNAGGYLGSPNFDALGNWSLRR